MDLELVAGFAAVIASVLAVALVVLVSHGIIEKIHRKSLEARQEADTDGADDANRGHAR